MLLSKRSGLLRRTVKGRTRRRTWQVDGHYPLGLPVNTSERRLPRAIAYGFLSRRFSLVMTNFGGSDQVWAGLRVRPGPRFTPTGPYAIALSVTLSRRASSCSNAAGSWNAASAGSHTGVGCCASAPDASMFPPLVSRSRPPCPASKPCSTRGQSTTSQVKATQTGSQRRSHAQVSPHFSHCDFNEIGVGSDEPLCISAEASAPIDFKEWSRSTVSIVQVFPRKYTSREVLKFQRTK